MLKTFNVFNVEQIDGLPLTTETVSSEATFEPLPEAENLFQKSGADIIEKGQNAFFRPSTDEVWLPERHLFSDAANFYATGLHELVHWTGGEKRLNREMKGTFGSADYAEEELVAEPGSAFLMADLGIVGEVQHESYITSWPQALKNDKRYVFKAASAASKAHRYLMDKIWVGDDRPQRSAALTLYRGREGDRCLNFPANFLDIIYPENSQAACAGGKEPAHPVNGVCTAVIAANDGSGMRADCEVCRTATVAEPVFGVMISVLCCVMRTYFMQERNHDRETTQHAERDHDSRACLTGKSA